jgi:acyl-coenzyme A synthetase/AMP-(fatty) acid ligase
MCLDLQDLCAINLKDRLLSDGKLTLEWAQVGKSVLALETFLTESGVARYDPVALECPNSVPGVLTLLALLFRGTTTALLAPPSRLDLSQPPPRFLRHLLRVRSPLLSGSPISLVQPATFLDVQPIEGPRVLPPESALHRGRLLLRTSGSLGTPKLVAHTHERLLANAANAVERIGLRKSDRVLIPVPIAHMYGLGAALLPALLIGANVELIEGTNLLRYLEHERKFRPTVAFLTPNLCSMLIRPRSTTAEYRYVVVAGDRLAPELFAPIEKLYQRVLALYGSTELGVICAMDAEPAAGSHAMTVGHPLKGVRLRLEARTETAALAGDCGELFCAHPFGFEGYVDDAGAPLTAEAAVASEWHPTRDLTRLHPDGSLEILGRSDHATKRDGRLVMLAEVERALCRLEEVERAAIVLGEETIRGRAMIAFVTLRPEALARGAGEEMALRKACASWLPGYAIPDEIRPIAELPALASGKVDRQALLALSRLPFAGRASAPHRQEFHVLGRDD